MPAKAIVALDPAALQSEYRRLRRALISILCDHPEPNEGDNCAGCVARKALRLPSTWRRGMKLPPSLT